MRRAKRSAQTAEAGTSIIAPMGMAGSKGTDSRSSERRTSASRASTCCSSCRPEIMGTSSRTAPWAEARRIARSWSRNIAGSRRQSRIARRPRAGLGDVRPSRGERKPLSAPMSRVRMVTAAPRIARATEA